MSLLYADLPERVEVTAPERGRLELVAGVVATLGVGLAGSTVLGDLLRSGGGGPAQASPTFGTPPPDFTGVERVVAPEVGAPTLLGPIEEINFPPADEVAAEEATVGPITPAPLPDAGTPPIVVAPADPPAAAEPAAPIVLQPIEPVEATPADGPTTTQPPTTEPPAPPTTLAPAEPAPELRQLVQTAGFTLTPQSDEVLRAGGLEGWLAAQLQPDTIPDPLVADALGSFDLLDTPPAELRATGLGPRALTQVRWASFIRSFVGERQILEHVAGVWREQFAVAAPPADLVGLEQIIRPRALGLYSDLVAAALETSAFRVAFDLSEGSTADDFIDSSFARVILERLTLGSPDVFTEADVMAVANSLGPGGTEIRATVARLCAQPETADAVSRRLATHFLGPVAAERVTEHGAAAYLSSGGSIAAVVHAILANGVPHAAGDRTHRGDGWLCAALRACGAEIAVGGTWDGADSTSIAGLLRLLDAEPGTGKETEDAGWETPAAVQARWTAARRLVGEGGAGVSMDLTGLTPALPLPADLLVDELGAALGVALTDGERGALRHYLGVEADTVVDHLDDEDRRDLVALVLSFPTFQRRSRAS